jgi:hypothetical protein
MPLQLEAGVGEQLSAVGNGADSYVPGYRNRRAIRAIRGRTLFAIWLALSLFWGAAVAYDLYSRATEQAAMSVSVERDLDRGFVNASCAGPDCMGGTDAAATNNWSDIASTYLRFGAFEIGEYAFGPPLAVLGMGLTVLAALRWRRLRLRAPRGSFPPAA